MLALTVTNKQETLTLSHPAGPLELGRGPARAGAARVVVRDAFVSRDHLKVEEVAGRKVRVENLSSKAPVTAEGHAAIGPGTAREFFLPARFGVGESTIEVDVGEAASLDDKLLRTVSAPVRGGPAPPSLLGLGAAAPVEEVVGWLETVVAVQKSSTPQEFYEQTAAALVDRIGLDAGIVLLRDGEAWRVMALVTKDDRGQGRAFSQTILKRVLADGRTFYTAAAGAGGGESLAGVQGVVASPIFEAGRRRGRRRLRHPDAARPRPRRSGRSRPRWCSSSPRPSAPGCRGWPRTPRPTACASPRRPPRRPTAPRAASSPWSATSSARR